ncbi:MAG: hypothetical protein U5K54_14880 [Cytophagales bacterium]|nr:hypothetical protein [Cytophagales bacterium]
MLIIHNIRVPTTLVLITERQKTTGPGSGEVILYSQYEKMNLSTGGKWTVGKDTLLASALVDDGWNIGFPALPMDVGSAKARIYSLGYNRFREHGHSSKI